MFLIEYPTILIVLWLMLGLLDLLLELNVHIY